MYEARRLAGGFAGSRAVWRRAAEAVLVLVGLTIAAGGFVAGTRAGLTYNTFPLMDGSLVPAGYAQCGRFLNWFENIAAISSITVRLPCSLWRRLPCCGRRAAPLFQNLHASRCTR